MYLNIPVKLESYVSVIKEQTKFISNEHKLTLLKLGTTKGNDSSKLMYLIYNPFPISMMFDCNSFLPSGDIFKTYPANIVVSPQTAYAFVAFVNNTQEINLNEALILSQLRKNISSRILKLGVTRDNEFEESRMYEVDPQTIEVNKTINLEQFSTDKVVNDIDYTKYTSKYESLIIVSLDSVDTLVDEVKLNIKFENIDQLINLEMSGFRLKMEDSSSKIIINAKESFNVKATTKKIVSVIIKDKEFDRINLEEMKIKITII